MGRPGRFSEKCHTLVLWDVPDGFAFLCCRNLSRDVPDSFASLRLGGYHYCCNVSRDVPDSFASLRLGGYHYCRNVSRDVPDSFASLRLGFSENCPGRPTLSRCDAFLKSVASGDMGRPGQFSEKCHTLVLWDVPDGFAFLCCRNLSRDVPDSFASLRLDGYHYCCNVSRDVPDSFASLRLGGYHYCRNVSRDVPDSFASLRCDISENCPGRPTLSRCDAFLKSVASGDMGRSGQFSEKCHTLVLWDVPDGFAFLCCRNLSRDVPDSFASLRLGGYHYCRNVSRDVPDSFASLWLGFSENCPGRPMLSRCDAFLKMSKFSEKCHILVTWDVRDSFLKSVTPWFCGTSRTVLPSSAVAICPGTSRTASPV